MKLMNANSLPGGWLESGHGSIALYVKDFRDPLARKKKLILKPWASVKDVKDQLHVVFNVPANVQKLYFHGRELRNHHTLQQSGIYQDNVVLDFVARRADGFHAPLEDASSSPSSLAHAAVVNIHPYGAHLLPVSLMKVLHQSLQGMALGLAPVLAMDGTGGTYFLKDPNHRNVGCFKPQDEEPFGPNNPRGLVGVMGQSGLRRGILSGEACERELAAYLLDRDHFAGVPATSLVEARHPVFQYEELASCDYKMGSLQEFVRHDDVASDLAPSQFSAHQVHKIVLLDMRLVNTDRNDANILVRKRRHPTTSSVEYELIPIDHGYCLPQYLEIAWCDWCWFNWPQLREPLSPEDKAYVIGLNPVEDADRLARKIPLRRACRRNMVIAGTLVQKGVKADLVLYEIAKIMCREDLDAPSTLERLCLEAYQLLLQRHRTKGHENGARESLSSAPSLHGDEAPVLSPHANGSADKDATSSKFANLRISTSDLGPDLSHDNSSPHGQNNSGARSPPGFWASYTPFSTRDGREPKKWSWADDSDDDEDYTYLPFQPLAANASASTPPALGSRQSSFVKWDDLAANALTCAAEGVLSNGKKHKVHDDDDDDRASVVSSTFGDKNDKDEFEVLNDALDANVQDERLFLSILGRLLDDKISECVQQQQIGSSRKRNE